MVTVDKPRSQGCNQARPEICRFPARGRRSRCSSCTRSPWTPRRPALRSFRMDPLVIAFGLGVGILFGLTRIGGGSLMTPLLILFVGINPSVAIGTDLAYGAITKTVGGWRLLRQGTVDLGVSSWLAVGRVPGSIAGGGAVDRLHERHGDGL